MLFNSFAFMIFLPTVFVLYWLSPHQYRWALMLVASYYFYMCWDVKYVVLILFTTSVSYGGALLIEKQESKIKKKIILTGTIICCLGVLFFFKYFNFVSESIVSILKLFAIQMNPITLNLLLPVGISFYTFQTMSYVIDVYNGVAHAEKHFGYYAAFISFFPQLVAGPIERTSNLLPQIKEKHEFNYDQATYGMKLMAWGFLKKMCIADVIAVHVDSIYDSLNTNTGFPLLLAIFGFTIQIYCDFSGYSDIAIGTAKLFGINLMTNFRSPYFSDSIKTFWSRWHISLSTWFRDYVYIPLGGNRCSKLRQSINVFITFLISGLWHGANWTFVIWGGIHGLAQIAENALKTPLDKLKHNKIGHLFSVIITFIFCSYAWTFFRAESFYDAIYVIVHAFDGISLGKHYFSNIIGMSHLEQIKILLLLAILAMFDFASLKIDVIEWMHSKNIMFRWLVYIVLIMFLFLFAKVGNDAFIYFQF